MKYRLAGRGKATRGGRPVLSGVRMGGTVAVGRRVGGALFVGAGAADACVSGSGPGPTVGSAGVGPGATQADRARVKTKSRETDVGLVMELVVFGVMLSASTASHLQLCSGQHSLIGQQINCGLYLFGDPFFVPAGKHQPCRSSIGWSLKPELYPEFVGRHCVITDYRLFTTALTWSASASATRCRMTSGTPSAARDWGRRSTGSFT